MPRMRLHNDRIRGYFQLTDHLEFHFLSFATFGPERMHVPAARDEK
jgi:hypothetical protein